MTNTDFSGKRGAEGVTPRSSLTCSRTSNCWQKKKTYDLCLTAMTTLTTNQNRTPLRIVAAIIAISAVASLFLCLARLISCAADVAGTHLLFLPALNALPAIALVTGFCFIRARRVSEYRAAMFTAFVFSSLFLRHLHHQSRPPWRHALSRPGGDSLRLLPAAHLAHRSLGRGPADDSHHFFSLAQWSLSRAPASGPIHFPNLALRLGQRRNRLRHARGLSMRQPAGNIIQEAPLEDV